MSMGSKKDADGFWGENVDKNWFMSAYKLFIGYTL
jgi:hypothetical protein